MDSPEKKLSDTGTRYAHLKELSDSWEICIEIIKREGAYLNPDKQRRLDKLLIAYEILNLTIDSSANYHDIDEQYNLGRRIRLIPKAEEILGGRGTPLCKFS